MLQVRKYFFCLQVRKAYHQLMFELGILLGGDPKSVTEPLKEVFDFEKKIAQVSCVFLSDNPLKWAMILWSEDKEQLR